MNRWKLFNRLIPLLAGLVFLLSGCSVMGTEPNPLDPRGSVARDQLFQIKFSLGVMIGVLIIVFAIFFYVIIRYRKRRGQNDLPKQTEGSHLLEVIWTVVPILLIVIIAVPTVYYVFKFSKDYSTYAEVERVNVTAHQFWWEFEYPDYGIITAQDLYIPVGKKIAINLESADVIHSFWVPALAGKQDTTAPHMYIDADEPGVYKGKCAELCGPAHALMDFKVIAVSQEEYDAWVANMTKPAASVAADVETGQELFKSNCIYCHAIDAGSGSLGPNLNNFGNRLEVAGFMPNTAENLHDWIKDPLAKKEGVTMPQLPLSDDQISDIVKYLHSLK